MVISVLILVYLTINATNVNKQWDETQQAFVDSYDSPLSTSDSYDKIGGAEGRRKVVEVETLTQEVKGNIRAEQIKLGVYVLVVSLIITLLSRRYVHMMSIRREIDEDRRLFRG